MKEHQAEGWYLDPYQVHHDRWMSAGVPTKLVRDGHSAQEARRAVFDLFEQLPPPM